jgi:hypothetical protein
MGRDDPAHAVFTMFALTTRFKALTQSGNVNAGARERL